MLKEALEFAAHVLIYDLIKPLPCSYDYFHDCFQALPRNAADHSYEVIVQFGRKRWGWIGTCLTNWVLLFFCLPVCLVADWTLHGTHAFWIKMAMSAVAFGTMVEQFDVLRVRDKRNQLKFLYLLSCLLSSSYWSVTCVLLAAFENMVC